MASSLIATRTGMVKYDIFPIITVFGVLFFAAARFLLDFTTVTGKVLGTEQGC